MLGHDEAEAIFGGAAAAWRSNPTQLGHDLVELVVGRKFLTCRNCWFIRQSVGKLATCTARSKGPTKKQVATWKGLKQQRGLQARFAEVWGVPLSEAVAWYEHSPLRNVRRRAAASQPKRGLKRPAASKHGVLDSWKRDVCEDGDVHPNPGPCSSWRVVSLNVGGVPGTWKAIDAFLLDKSVAVLALQEVSACDNELSSIRRKALASGYRFYHQPGVPSVAHGICRRHGGVSLFVRSSLRQRPAFALAGDDSQCLGVWVDGWLLVSAYCPPRPDHVSAAELSALLLDAFTANEVAPTQPWLIAGDFNELVGASAVDTTMACFGGEVVTVDEPTRWEGNRCIDWMITNRPRACGPPCLLSIVLSDHVPIEVLLHNVPHDVLLGRLRRTTQFTCPSGVDRAYWDNTIQTVWSEDIEVQSFLTFLENNPPVSVQDEWDSFQCLLVQVMQKTCLALSQNGFLTAEARDACFCAASQTPFKGQVAQYHRTSAAQAGVRHQVGDLAIRKLRRLLARCYELKRLLVRSAQGQLSSAHANELHGLQRRLMRRFGNRLGLREVLFHISSLKVQLQNHDRLTRDRRLRDWRNDLVESDACLSRWLKSKVSPVGVAVADAQGRIAETDVQAAEIIFDYWQAFWNERDLQNLPVDDRVQSILHEVNPLPVHDWQAPSGVVLRQLACDAKGAGGPDGWTGRELGLLPLDTFRMFSLLAQRWLLCGAVPQQMCESRMVCLPKPGKVQGGNVVAVQHTRPITVLSAWWRLWSSAWARGLVRAWMRAHIPVEFAVAHAKSTGEVVVDLLDSLYQYGYLLTLDFTKAFDCLDPLVTREVLVHLGWDGQLVQVLIAVWQRQRRWVSYQSHTHPAQLSGPSMPQGDPLGPVIMTIWAWLGWLHVERQCRRVPHVVTRVYVDDRSCVVSRAWALSERYHHWSQWSASVGLCENQAKAVAVASTPARRVTLRSELPNVASLDVELLGSCSMTRRRGLLPRESVRVDACRVTLTLLSCIRLPFERYMRACRQFAVSKVAYGWIARAPSLTLCKNLWSLVHVGSRRIRASSPWLRAAVLGGGMHLDVLFATQLVGIFSRLQRSRELVWLESSGSPAHAFNAWLVSHGWTRLAEWQWSHADTGLSLNLTSVGDSGQRQHVVRDAWRAWCLRRHMASDRRDAQLDCFHAVGGYFRRIDWRATRAFAASCPEAKTVVCGATFSPAALGGRVEHRPSTACIWGNCTGLGTFDHIAWECVHRPCDVPKPAEFLSSRYGWAITNQNVDITLVQDWLVQVQKAIWACVHP